MRFGHTADRLTFSDDGAEVEATNAETGARVAIKARFVLDCSGAGRVLPQLMGVARPAGLATRAAVFLATFSRRW